MYPNCRQPLKGPNMIASLHAGLIERSRAKPEPVGVVKLRTAVEPPPQVAGPVKLPQAQGLTHRPMALVPLQRRYGLTVRVDQKTRKDLADLTSASERTVQDVLHSALVGYLARARRFMDHKE